MLAEDTIDAGTCVLLDVREQRLLVSKSATTGKSVYVQEYTIASQNDALDFFEYLENYKDRFQAVKIV